MRNIIKTKALCPTCKKVAEAEYIERNGQVVYVKTCPIHGKTEVVFCKNWDDFFRWNKRKPVNIAPRITLTKGSEDKEESQCPLHCGTCKNHLQTACCVLIEVTKRCNQYCPFCFAEAEGQGAAASGKRGRENKEAAASGKRGRENKEAAASGKRGRENKEAAANGKRGGKNGEETRNSLEKAEGKPEGEPTLEEIKEKLKFLKEVGEEVPFNIQISGGEPTVREDLEEIIKMAAESGFEYIQINSNGKRIGEEKGYAQKLKEAGASVIFMQFDGTEESIQQKLRGENLLETKKKAIENCREARLPITLVPTIVNGANTKNIGSMIAFMLENLEVIKGIHFQPVSYFGRYPEEEKRVSMFDVLEEIEKQTTFFKKKDFLPIGTGHPLCCFYSTYVKDGEKIICQLTEQNKTEGVSCCDTQETNLGIIKKDRGFVLNKWNINQEEKAEKITSSKEAKDFDQLINFFQENTFTITGMAFQDIETLDAERLKRCRVQVLSEDNRLIPFCAYNTIYRGGKNV